MGWKRVKGHWYYYESTRVGRRVVSRYVGRGEFAALMEAASRLIRAERARLRAAEGAEQARLEADDRPAIEFHRGVMAAARATLEAGGFYRHHGGEWRRRGATVKTTKAVAKQPAGTATEAEASAPPLPGPDIPLPELLERARSGDVEVRWRLRALLERGLDRRYAHMEMGSMLELTLAGALYSTNVLQQEIEFREIRRTADALAGPDPSPLESLLAQDIAVCRFTRQRAEWRCAAEIDASRAEGQVIGNDRIKFLDRRVDGAHRRLMQAVKTLAVVRRLQGPGPAVSVRVNQTVNVEAQATPEAAAGLDVPALMKAAPRG